MKAIQLKLWPDDGRIDVHCPHCGHRFDVLPQLECRQTELEQRALNDPRVRMLPRPRREFLKAALPVFLFSQEPVGISTIAEELTFSKSGAYRQVSNLVRAGILIAEPKRVGGQYNQYRLALWNGTS